MSMYKDLEHEFKRLEGQPVKVFMNDRHEFVGLVLMVGEYSVKILTRCGDVLMVEYAHIDAIEEPQMHLKCCRNLDRCANFGEEDDGKCDDRR